MAITIIFGDLPDPPDPPDPEAIPFPDIEDVNVYASNLIRVVFADEILVNEDYYDVSNYSVEVYDGSGPVQIRKILPLEEGINSSLDVYIQTDAMTPGTTYTLGLTGLQGRNDNSLETPISVLFDSRVTKLDSTLKSIPSHFHKATSSLLYACLLATAASDDLIGGARDDSYTYS